MSFSKVSAAALCLAQLANAQTGPIHINPKTRFFEDEAGRSVFFHGVNVVYKVDPYIPSIGDFDHETSLNAEDIHNLVNWGQNFVRLGVMWEAVERTEGVYDEEYLNKVEDLINALGEQGIYTLVDAHQDVFARTMCGEGVPDFYAKEAVGRHPTCVNVVIDRVLKPIYEKLGVCISIKDYEFEFDENDDPVIADCQTQDFYVYYSSPESLRAFQALYTNKNGIRDKFVAYWDRVSLRFANNPYVVGYDPLNEPGLTDPYPDPTLMLPGHMDREYLSPMFAEVFEKYYANSDKSVMWFEPMSTPDEIGIPPGYVFPVGYDTPPGGEIGSANHVLNDHTYCCQLSPLMCATGEPREDKAAECLAFHRNRIHTRALDAERLGIPLHITEFGACLTEGPCTQEITQVADVCDENLVGWAYWEFKTYKDLTTSASTGAEGFYNHDGSLQTYKVKALARTYMQATQGVPTYQNFNSDSGEFVGEYIVDTDIEAPTRIYTNREYWYPEGVDIEVYLKVDSGKEMLAHDAYHYEHRFNHKYLDVHIKGDQYDGRVIGVRISAKASARLVAEDM